MEKGVRAGKTKRPLCEGEVTATARTHTLTHAYTRIHLSTGRHTGTHRLLLRFVYAKRPTKGRGPYHTAPGPSTPASVSTSGSKV